jgi:guanylate kinase
VEEQELCVLPRVRAAFEQIEHYMLPTPLLAIISGPSGAGKDSVVKRMRELNYPFHFVVTTTDRPPRPGEVNGLDYHFVSTATFDKMIANDELFEHAVVYGQHKGIPKAQVREALSSGMDVIMRLDVQGAATVRRLVPEALAIFLVPPSIEILIDRLRRRGGDSRDQILRRLDSVVEEIRCIKEFDYVVVNREGRLDETVKQIAAIISAERFRTARRCGGASRPQV